MLKCLVRISQWIRNPSGRNSDVNVARVEGISPSARSPKDGANIDMPHLSEGSVFCEDVHFGIVEPVGIAMYSSLSAPARDSDYGRCGNNVHETRCSSLLPKSIQSSHGEHVGILPVISAGSNGSVSSKVYKGSANIPAKMPEWRQSRNTVAVTMKQYKSLYDNNIDAVFQFDLEGNFVDVNDSFLHMFGYTLSELRQMSFRSIVVDADVASANSVFERTKTGHTTRHEVEVWHRTGKRMTVQVVSVPIKINGRVTGTFGITTDITSLRYSQKLLANQKHVLEMIARGISVENVLYELTKIVEDYSPNSMCNVFLLEDDNRTLKHLTGHERRKDYSDNLGGIQIGPDVGACGTAPYLNKIVIVEDIGIDPLYDKYRHISLEKGLRACFATPIVSSSGQVMGTLGLYYDKIKRPSQEEIELLTMISHLAGLAIEKKRADDQIMFLAHYDTLTGLPNRTTFLNQMKTALTNAGQGNYRLAIMFLDIDRFKSINDSLGHHFGDRVLKVVAERVSACLDTDTILSRLGGDEFTVLLPHIDHMEQARTHAQRVIDSFHEPVVLDEHEFRLTTSVGIAVFPDHGDTAETLMRKADVAMYEAKKNGKHTFRLYSDSMDTRFYERLMTESALRCGLDNEEFTLHYQPRIDTKSKTVQSVEALLRWNRPGVGIVSPAEFIPVAEETGLILPIGKWVLYEVCRQITVWEAYGKLPIPIAVNVSPRQFQEPDFVDMVRAVIKATGVDPRMLEIEVTESGLIDSEADALGNLYELKALGINISIDDFGVGYSSLNRLKNMPVDALKIDGSFIRDMFQDDAAITKTIITLAHNLHMTVVAEGVETEEQFSCLQQYGCDQIQGYYFAPPLCVADFEKRYLENGSY